MTKLPKPAKKDGQPNILVIWGDDIGIIGIPSAPKSRNLHDRPGAGKDGVVFERRHVATPHS